VIQIALLVVREQKLGGLFSFSTFKKRIISSLLYKLIKIKASKLVDAMSPNMCELFDLLCGWYLENWVSATEGFIATFGCIGAISRFNQRDSCSEPY
jgi:hypothetical protein